MEHSTTRVDELVALNLAAGKRLEIIERGRNGRARLTTIRLAALHARKKSEEN